MRLDQLAERQRQHHGRQEAYADIEHKAPGLAAGGQLDQGAADLLPIHQDHREDRAGLDGDVEHLGFFALEAQQRARKNQMTSGRNGQELGQAFDHAHEGGLDQQYDIHRDVLFGG
ncbi:hypothetical protein D3C78_1158820 [compost metagenome]